LSTASCPCLREAAFAVAVELFHAWGSQRGTKSDREPTQVLEQVANFLDRHGDSRFSPREHEVSVKDRAGWYDEEDGERLYLFTSQGLHEALKGFDFSPSLDVLVAAGAQPPRGKDGKHGRVLAVRGESKRLYPIDPRRLTNEAY
jgi:putative DNA primase/helicase